MNQTDKYVAAKVAQLRRRLAISQDEISHIMGISQSAYSERESYNVPFKFSEITALAEYSNTPIQWFVPMFNFDTLRADI